MNTFRKTFEFGKQTVILETGVMARQALRSVTISVGGTVILVTTAAKKEIKKDVNFVPLTVHYQEKAYASGKIPGGFLRREGRPNECETLIARLIDRALRPLFPKSFYHEVQVVVTVLSFDSSIPPDVPAMIGASASLMLSGLPFRGPLAAVRVGFIAGEYLNATCNKLVNSELNLVVAGTKDGIVMVESEAKNLPEDIILGAILYGHDKMQPIIEAISDLEKHAGKNDWVFSPDSHSNTIKEYIIQHFYFDIEETYNETEKKKRDKFICILRKKIIDTIVKNEVQMGVSTSDIEVIFHELERELIRKRILEGSPRIDGRDNRTVRPISVKIGVLPKAHGSALFTRGDTQALVTITLGNDRDAQLIETLSGNIKSRYMLHYNFPPYSVGETGMIGAPKRREIGHANLAKRATQAVFPNEDLYPYVVRVVSEITESNGSSSMATVCGASLSMMDAGIPIAAPVAGIAMGLVKDENRFAVLSDILGDEDHLGDMDLKVAGTQYGVTALQMDIKTEGITADIINSALIQAKDGRLHILKLMNEVISKPKAQIPDHAPQVKVIKVNPAKIRDVIGKGGVTIKGIIEKTGATIDTSDNGEIKIFAKNKKGLEATVSIVEALTANAEIGKKYSGKVVKKLDFGVFVNILPGKDGLLLFSDLKNSKSIPSNLSEGSFLEVLYSHFGH